jgi:thiol-disulfide isomerase/thioredoxin
MSDWERGEVSKERMAEARAQSLEGRPAPELDGLIWLNAPRESMRLADFRGKYVLLDFWTTWCGPCHADFPTLKLLHELYKDRGLAVIGIHDNSVPADTVREHVKRQGLPFPVVIDRPDGQILSRYKPHGVRFYPSYLLIGPDGNVLHQDAAIPGPTLHTYMFEIIRGHLIGK